MRRRTKWIISAGIASLVGAAVVGPFVYSALSDEPPSLIERRFVTDGVVSTADADGRWVVGEGSVVGYRVEEQIGLAELVAVGRTNAVTGAVEIRDGALTAAAFEVDMTTFRSDRSQRDEQFRTRIMDTVSHPTAGFRFTPPLRLPATVSPTEPIGVSGELELRGTTRSVTFDIYTSVDGDRLHLTGATEIVFRDWGIPNPSVPSAFIYTADTGTLEFDIVLEPTD
jgi:polyisoprenoid-binding protein YceI